MQKWNNERHRYFNQYMQLFCPSMERYAHAVSIKVDQQLSELQQKRKTFQLKISRTITSSGALLWLCRPSCLSCWPLSGCWWQVLRGQAHPNSPASCAVSLQTQLSDLLHSKQRCNQPVFRDCYQVRYFYLQK